MLLKDPNMRVGVIASVIASVLVILFIQPLMNLAWVGLVALASHVSTSALNALYHDAAQEESDAAPLLVLIVVLAFFAMSFLTRGRRLDRLDRIFVGLLFVPSLLGGVAIYGKAEIAASYRQRLAVLAPHLPDREIKLLEADWKMVGTRADYRNLANKMESLATANSVSLPKLRP